MSATATEILQAWRGLFRRPGYLALAVLTLGLGIGATVTVFGLIDRILLEPLPVEQPEQLYAAGLKQDSGWTSITLNEYRRVEALDIAERLGLAWMGTNPVNVSDRVRPRVVDALRVDDGFFRALGVSMHLGRGFTADEAPANGEPTAAVIGWSFWQSHFGGDPDVIGQTVPVEGVPVPVVGVLPDEFRFVEPFDLVLPVSLQSQSPNGRNFIAALRLASGVSVDSADARIHRAIQDIYSGTDSEDYWDRSRFGLEPMSSVFGAPSRQVLTLFMGSAVCVLFLAVFNLGNLMVLRSASLSNALSIRRALGAGGGRLAIPMMAEGLLIGAAGVLAGVLMAAWGVAFWSRWVPASWHGGIDDWSLGANAVVFSLAAGLIPALLAALMGAWRGMRADARSVLHQSGRHGPDVGVGRLTRGLVVAQVVLAVVLLTGAGLFMRSLDSAMRVDPGFETAGITGFELSPLVADYPAGDDVRRLVDRIVDRLESQPGVLHATAGTNLPVGRPLNYPFRVPGEEPVSVEFRGVEPGYFQTFGIGMLAGRALGDSDRQDAPPVAVVNRRFAQSRLGLAAEPGVSGDRQERAAPMADAMAEAIGRTLFMPLGDSNERSLRIVGVVEDTRQFGPDQAPPPIVYVPFDQVPDPLIAMLREFMPLSFAVRGAAETPVPADSLREAVAEVAPGQPIKNLQPLGAVLDRSLRSTRLNLSLMGMFAGLALVLAMVGLYSVVAVASASRRREFAVRSALGATAGRLLARVMGDGLMQAVLGLVLGIAAALIASRSIGHFFQSIAAHDPVVLGGISALLLTVALLATTVPAWRAANTPPMDSLREE